MIKQFEDEPVTTWECDWCGNQRSEGCGDKDGYGPRPECGPIPNKAERLLNSATDYIAATLEAADRRAWSQLLIYAPSDVLLECLIGKLNLDNINPMGLTIGEIKRALP